MQAHLVSKLLDCAAAINDCELNLADSLFKKLQSEISADTNIATGKVVKYFAEALVRRVYKLYPRNSMPLIPSAEFRDYENYVFYPFFWFAEFTTHAAMVNALIGRNQVHVIDFSFTTNGWRWYTLMEVLAKQPCGPPSFRLTCIRPKLSENFDYLQEMNKKLTAEAKKLQMDFKLRQLVANSALDISKSILKVRRTSEDEAIVVKWEHQLHKLLALPDVFEHVLSKVKELKPELMLVVELEANHSSTDFLDNFTKLVQYYLRVFDSIEKDTFRDDNDYKFLWEMYFRRLICNEVALEGTDIAERHETLVQWQDRFFHAGFLPVRLSIRGIKGALFCDLTRYKITKKDHAAMLCLEDLPLAVTSAWKPDPAHFCSGSQFNHLTGESEKESLSEPHDDESEGQTIMRRGNMWSPECFTINRIAYTAEIFDILEYVCHVHKLPLALTWISEGRDTNSDRKVILRIENTACYVNDVEMKEFMEACAELHLEEGQGVVGKALRSDKHFVSDVSKLDVIDYPLAYKALEFGLRSAFAIKMESTCTNNDSYILEFFLPPKMQASSEQESLISAISCTLQQTCKNLRMVSDLVSNGAIGFQVGLDEAGMPNHITASSSEIGSLNTNDMIMIRNMLDPMPPANGMEIYNDHQQEVSKQNSTTEPAPNDNNEEFSKVDSHCAVGTNKRRRTSEVWKGFHEVRENGEVWAICKYCDKKYRGESNRGTTNLLKHLKNCSRKEA